MDLGYIGKWLAKNEYASPDLFAKDVRQVSACSCPHVVLRTHCNALQELHKCFNSASLLCCRYLRMQ